VAVQSRPVLSFLLGKLTRPSRGGNSGDVGSASPPWPMPHRGLTILTSLTRGVWVGRGPGRLRLDIGVTVGTVVRWLRVNVKSGQVRSGQVKVRSSSRQAHVKWLLTGNPVSDVLETVTPLQPRLA
jgi:hypothetical protein